MVEPVLHTIPLQELKLMSNCAYCNKPLDEHSFEEIQLCYYKSKLRISQSIEEVE